MDTKNDIYYSSASVRETTIKYMAKPDRIHISGSELSNLCKKMGYRMLPITHDSKIPFYEEECVVSV